MAKLIPGYPPLPLKQHTPPPIPLAGSFWGLDTWTSTNNPIIVSKAAETPKKTCKFINRIYIMIEPWSGIAGIEGHLKQARSKVMRSPDWREWPACPHSGKVLNMHHENDGTVFSAWFKCEYCNGR